MEGNRLLYCSKELESHKFLIDYGIEKRSTLYHVSRLRGGSQRIREKVLDHTVELSDAPDMITWDDDPENKRVKMPCGHAISKRYWLCLTVIVAGFYQFDISLAVQTTFDTVETRIKEPMFFSFRVCRCCILSGYFIGYSASSCSKFSLKIMHFITQLKLLYKLTPSPQTKGLVINYKGSRVAGRNSCFGIGCLNQIQYPDPCNNFWSNRYSVFPYL